MESTGGSSDERRIIDDAADVAEERMSAPSSSPTPSDAASDATPTTTGSSSAGEEDESQVSPPSEEQEGGRPTNNGDAASSADADEIAKAPLQNGHDLRRQPSGVHSDVVDEALTHRDDEEIASDDEDDEFLATTTSSFRSSPDPVPSLASSPEEDEASPLVAERERPRKKQPSGKLAWEAQAAAAAMEHVRTPPPLEDEGQATTLLEVLQQDNLEQQQQQQNQVHPLQSPSRRSPNPNSTTPRTPAPTPNYTPMAQIEGRTPQTVPYPPLQQQHQQHVSPLPVRASHAPQLQQQQQQQPIPQRQPRQPRHTITHTGRRSITLRLLEEIPPPASFSSPLMSSVKSFDTPFRSLRRFRSLSLSSSKMSSVANSAMKASASIDTELDPLDEKAVSPTSSLVNGRGKARGTGESTVDRGTIVVSWYEGTTSTEMTDHVFNCVVRKLNGDRANELRGKNVGGKIRLEDVRLLDESVTPHGEEVVLCPYLPDGSSFLLKFKTSVEQPPPAPKVIHKVAPPYASRAPDSPSAEPSPFPSNADLPSLSRNRDNIQQQNAQQQQQQLQTQQMLGAVAALLQQQSQQQPGRQLNLNTAQLNGFLPRIPLVPDIGSVETVPEHSPATPIREEKKEEDGDTGDRTTPISSNTTAADSHGSTMNRVNSGLQPLTMEPIVENPTMDQQIEQQLRQLNELFTQRKSNSGTPSNSEGAGAAAGTAMNESSTEDPHDAKLARAYYREEKRQVIFIIANYLVLFMSLIAISAEIQSRLPQWMDTVQQNYDSVQNCATDRDALTECLSNGDFSGLVASFLLWATQSVAAKRIFLFGFDTPKKLWTVVYEALVTAVCWGTSYIFIRRGLNPNTRQNFLHKYWKDAVYGSLAGFNAAFMKAVLKNLIPQDVALEALEGRQLRIFHWLGSMMADE